MINREEKLKKEHQEYVNETVGFSMPLVNKEHEYYLEKRMRAIAMNAYYNGYMYAKSERNDLTEENK